MKPREFGEMMPRAARHHVARIAGTVAFENKPHTTKFTKNTKNTKNTNDLLILVLFFAAFVFFVAVFDRSPTTAYRSASPDPQ